MDKAQIEHLGTLSRIKLTAEEVEKLEKEIGSILEYVSVINEVVADAHLEKKVGPVHNVFREDEVTVEADEYTDAIVAEFPEKKGRFLKVKKILNPDS